MARPKIVLTGEDKTKPAFDSVKRGLADVVDASGKASGSLERFLKLSPKMIAIGAAGAGVGLTLRSVYRNSAELQAASSELGESWKLLTAELGRTQAAKAAADSIGLVSSALNSLRKAIEEPPKQSWLEGQTERLNEIGGEILKAQEEISANRDNPLRALNPFLPTDEELQSRISAMKSYLISASTKLNDDVAKNGRPMDAFNPKQFTDEEWKSLLDKSASGFEKIKALEKDKNDSVKADIDRQREAAKALSDEYMSAYTETRTPQEEFINALERANKLFQSPLGDADMYGRQIKAARDKLENAPEASDPAIEKQREAAKALADEYMRAYTETRGPQEEFIEALKRANELFQSPLGDAELYGKQIQQARDKLAAATENQNFSGVGNRLAALDESLQTETERIEQEYQERANLSALAYSAGLIDLQGYKNRETQAWANAESQKSKIAESESAARKRISDAELQRNLQFVDTTANLLGSLSSLAEGRNREDFKKSQRIARAQTLVQGAAAAVRAYNDGGWYGVAAVVAFTAAQLNKINETSYSGGGSIAAATGGGAGGVVPGSTQAAPQSDNNQRSGGTTNIYIQGAPNSVLTVDQVAEIAEQMRIAYANGDYVNIKYDDRQARVIRGEAA